MSGKVPLRVTVNIDGGARGNPGPAAAGIVIRSSDNGKVLHQAGIFLGEMTNNAAEYMALLEALKTAARLGAEEAEVFSDSELLVRQMTGEYRVREPTLKALFDQAGELVGMFRRFRISHIRREENAAADKLVNQAINLKRRIEDAAD